ncbi:MAG: T9SS type A sorting domain-containing protein, partial [Ignavibacteriaceae bacterium]|nr:T9SS type A sorting domain-containing protein [Ignavibacteriaceae bacterium]
SMLIAVVPVNLFYFQASDVQIGSKLPETYLLSPNYPNPFNPSTKIKYSVPKVSFVTLKVYDVLGKEVATLVNEERQQGTYEIEFNGTGLPSGIYFYQLKGADPESSSGQGFVETKKMLLLK